MRKRYIAVLLTISMFAGLTACGNPSSSGGSTESSVIPETAEDTGTTRSDTGSDRTKGQEDTAEPNGAANPKADATILDPSDDDRLDYNPYYQLMLARSPDENCVFSPESMNTAFDMYSYLLEPEDQKVIQSYCGNRPYLTYSSTDVFKITNRLWINSNKDFHLPEDSKIGNGIAYYIDMSDPKATDEKNQYVSQQTNGFISSTPTEFNNDVVFDAMNILYFKDTWKDGDKWLESITTPFTNEDGTVSDVYMMHDGGEGYLQSSNAHGYSMQYEDGFRFLVILPDEGAALSAVDVNAFIQGEVEYVSHECYLAMPEFETESTYQLGMEDFGLPVSSLAKEVYEYEAGSPQITQVAKIRVDHEGTEAAAISEIVNESAAISVDEPYLMVCDRPFIYVIQDTENEDVAFIGAVRELKTMN